MLDLADELGASAIVMATHGRGGVKRIALGSVAMQIVSHTDVPGFSDPCGNREYVPTAGA